MFSFIVILSAFVCVSHVYSDGTVPSRYLIHDNNQYYVDSIFKGNFYESVEFCNRLDMKLLAIESKEELEAVDKYLRGLYPNKQETFWTSGSQLGNGKDFVWLSTGKEVTVLSWPVGEPNNAQGNQNCIQLDIKPWSPNFIYDDFACDSKMFAVCRSKGRIAHVWGVE